MSLDDLETRIEFLDDKERVYINEYPTNPYYSIYLHTLCCENDLCTFLVNDENRTKIISKKLGNEDEIIDEFQRVNYFERHGNYLVVESNKKLLIYEYKEKWDKIFEEDGVRSIYKLQELSLAFFLESGFVAISKEGIFSDRRIGDAILQITSDEKHLIKGKRREYIILGNRIVHCDGNLY